MDDLELLGLTDYEGRVYRALLAEHPATAYRLGKRSGVPLSRVYEIAARLVEKGAATVIGGEPARYVPVPPEQLVMAARHRAVQRLDTLAADLSALYAGREGAGHAWLRGEEAILSRAVALAAGSREELQVAAAPAAQDRLRAALQSAAPEVRTRALALALPGSSRGDAAFLLLADGEEALIGRLGPEADALATRHPALVRLCADYFRLRAVADAAQEMLSASRPAARAADPGRWLDWEEEKQRRLLQAH